MPFSKESDFEEALIRVLMTKGWEEKILRFPTEEDLLQNWADILWKNNQSIDRLGEYPLTQGEMGQILEQIRVLGTPVKLNGFINGKTVTIKRDNKDDKRHFGKEVSLKIYDRMEIAGGKSRYQIAQQPVFPAKSKMLNDRRGDLMLLINGMPVFHLELKKSGIPVSQAYHQIEKYAHESVFTGLFSLVQIFVAMTPEETVYFANPGPEGQFNPDYYFHWADFNNEPMNRWEDVATNLLSIPMAHQLIGFYTVADRSDGVLKVLRSYQYCAANKISDAVAKHQWEKGKQRGGYIWHTTGSGKTMTSFKSAQLIANSHDADKVVFLTDRIELGTQSFTEYSAFADDSDTVQETEDTYALISKLKSSAADDTLIVTSIQKMSHIRDEDGGGNAHDISIIGRKRLVFIVDEAHRSTFGDMLPAIKETFPRALFFGFTGTPIFEANAKKKSAQSDVFGSELHRYSIADGIRDGNVLGFDPYKVLTFKDTDVRRVVALEQAKAASEEEALADPAKAAVYFKYMDKGEVKMYGETGADGKWVKGIEDYLPTSQYQTEAHHLAVIRDMRENWRHLSHGGKFHAIFATSSIPEALTYYRLMKKELPELKITCLFDPNIDNKEGAIVKEDGLVEILTDYNARYMDGSGAGVKGFTIPDHAKFKKDVSARLAHKGAYKHVERTPEKELDLLIVVDQMLTGFDSKWVNTLYLDKLLKYENIIQAFSRTNRLFGPDKPFGVIRYYRRPHTMEQNILKAVKLYSGDRPLDLFVDRLAGNLAKMNQVYEEIAELFTHSGISDFQKLPDEPAVRAKFAALFRDFNQYLEAARVQGFTWNEPTYHCVDESTGAAETIEAALTEDIYLTLAQRYKELAAPADTPSGDSEDDVPYDLVGYLTEIDTGVIDASYMNSRFEKYLKVLKQEGAGARLLQEAEAELHKSFASLTQEEQKFAKLFLHDIQSGDITPEAGKTLRDYITEYQCRAKDDQIHRFAASFGMDEAKLRAMMGLHLKAENINEFGRFDDLIKTVDKETARAYLEKVEGKKLPLFKVNVRVNAMLRKFILKGGFAVAAEKVSEPSAQGTHLAAEIPAAYGKEKE